MAAVVGPVGPAPRSSPTSPVGGCEWESVQDTVSSGNFGVASFFVIKFPLKGNKPTEKFLIIWRTVELNIFVIDAFVYMGDLPRSITFVKS